MSEIELIIRIMIANVYHYGTTSMIEFNENHINEIVPKLNELFSNYGYKTEIFSKDEQSLTYKKFKDLMLSIFGDIIYIDDRPYDENWFGLYDDELECLDMVHLCNYDVKKYISLASNYSQEFIETGGYILTDDRRAFKSERDRLENSYKTLKRLNNIK